MADELVSAPSPRSAVLEAHLAFRLQDHLSPATFPAGAHPSHRADCTYVQAPPFEVGEVDRVHVFATRPKPAA